MKVVIVEDEVRIREGITGLLNKFYPQVSEIHEARCGADGIRLIRKLNPDIVITDIRMDPIDGLEMLDILLNQDKLDFKTVILSAYSEFEYAKKAISLGVREYLVKPVDVEEFHLVMKRLEEELVKDEKKRLGNSELFNSIDSILLGIISGQVDVDQDVCDFIEKTYSVKPATEMALLCVYLGKSYRETQKSVSHEMGKFTARKHNDMILFVAKDRLLLQVFLCGCDFAKLEKFCKDEMSKNIFRQYPVSPIFAFSHCQGIETLPSCFEQIKQYLPWSISLGADHMLVIETIKKLKPVAPSYPIGMERNSIALLCAGNGKELKKQGKQFLEYFIGHNYSPALIKKCVVRYFLALLQIAKEVRFDAYENLKEQEILENINAAQTGTELEEALYNILAITDYGEKPEGIGFLVQKVLRLVDEYYRDGITLKEVSNELEVSPDYISTQLTEDLGVNFSTYIKNYRIKKAKELLAGTDLKMFEIAEQTGYQDAKYFGKVFKAAEGIHPLDYRKKFR